MNRESMRYAPSLIVAGLVLIAVIVVLRLLAQVTDLLLVIFLGVILGVILQPVPDHLGRFRVPRVISVLLVYGLVLGALALVTWWATPQLVDEGQDLVDRLDTLEADYDRFADGTFLPSFAELRDSAESFGRSAGPGIANRALAGLSTALYLVMILIVAVFYTTVGHSARALTLSLLSPNHRGRADELLSRMAKRLRRFAVGELMSMTIVGVITYVGLTIIGVPFPFTLAVIAFLTEILPIVGPWLGFFPALAVAATEGPETMIAVAILYLAIQQLESNVIIPMVQHHQTELPALVIFVAVAIGGALWGILGALAALPMAILIDTVLMDLVVPWRQGRLRDEDESAEGEPDAEEEPGPRRRGRLDPRPRASTRP